MAALEQQVATATVELLMVSNCAFVTALSFFSGHLTIDKNSYSCSTLLTIIVGL